MYKKISEYIYDCNICPTPCDGISKKSYIFKNDVEYAEEQENLIIEKLTNKNFKARKCLKEGYPDIIVENNDKTFYLEVKAQRRTFMSVKRLLPYADLYPSETVALNLSDLLRYFEIAKKENLPIFILWVLENRPCIVPDGEKMFFYQNVVILEKIYQKYGDKRRFRRKSGRGDVVNGIHKGVVVNYHFSLRELEIFNL